MTPANEGRTTVLLVDQNDADVDSFEAMLEAAAPAAFDVARATTLAEATSFLATTTADCAVVDLRLPDAEALAIITTIAASSPAVALVALTVRDDEELGVATIEAGASDYLSRAALDGKMLVRCIRHAVLRKRFEYQLADARKEQELAEEALVHQALHDPLTGLPNRVLFLDRLRQALDCRRWVGRPGIDRRCDLYRHRSVQGDQRQPWLSGRRSVAAGGCHAADGSGATG